MATCPPGAYRAVLREEGPHGHPPQERATMILEDVWSELIAAVLGAIVGWFTRRYRQ